MAIDEYIPTEYINDSIPAINASNLNKIENAVKAVTDEVIIIGSVTPPGSIVAYGGSPAPQGYLECNGQEYSRASYDKLFSAIGTVHGSGNGSTTFNIPDLRGEFIRGLDAGRGVDENRVLGSSQDAAMQDHEHSMGKQARGSGSGKVAKGFDSPGSDYGTAIGEDGKSYTSTLTDSDYDVGDETRPRNIAMMYIIKT